MNEKTDETNKGGEEPARCAGSESGGAPGSAAWLVRRIEGMKRDTFGLFVDQSRRPLMKSKDEAALRRVADAHNSTLPPNDGAEPRRATDDE